MPRSDEQLMRATIRGDAEAFGVLFDRHHALVSAYLTRRCEVDQAADLVAETFARALVAFHDGRAPCGPTVTIARNALVDQHRRGRAEDSVRRRLELERLEPSTADLDHLQALGADLDGALAGLPEEQRDALRARVLDERPYDEIAREHGTSETAVRQRVSRALRRLRTDLEQRS